MGNCKIAGVLAAGVFFCALTAFAGSAEYQLEEIGVFGPYKVVNRGLVCSRDGSSWGFWGRNEKSFELLVDGEVRETESAWPYNLYFTADGSTWLYSVEREEGVLFVLVNGEEYGPYESWPQITCSRRGSSWGFTALVGLGKYAIINGTCYGPYNTEIFSGGLTPASFSEDGGDWGYEASYGDYWVAVINGEERDAYRFPGQLDYSFENFSVPIAFSGDGSVWGHTGFVEGGPAVRGFYAWIGDREFGPYKDISVLNISADGKQWGVKVTREEGPYALVNGVEIGPFEDCGRVKVANGGKSWGVPIQKNGEWYMRLNGDEIGPYFRVGSAIFSGNGQYRAFYAVRLDGDNRHRFAVIDGVEIGPFSDLNSIRLSFDGSTWAINVEKEDEKEYLIVNAEEFGPYGRNAIKSIYITENGDGWLSLTDYGHLALLNGKELGPFGSSAAFSTDDCFGFYATEEMEGGYSKVLKYTVKN